MRLAIIQARTNSSRLPNKMFHLLGGRPIIDWVISRVKKSKNIDKLALATSTNKKDDRLFDFALKNKIFVYRGDEENVLQRFKECADLFEPHSIVRVCADNPLIDSREIDKLINQFDHNKFDYAFNHLDKLNSKYADGFGAEIISYKTLKYIYGKAKSNYHREHLTSYIWDNLEKFKILTLNASKDLAYPNLRFDVDTQEDLDNLNSLISLGLDINSTAQEIINISTSLK